MRSRMLMLEILLLLSITLTICPVQAQLQTEDIEVRDYTFQPDSITVEPGTTVIWTNYDNDQHTVTSNEEIFDSGLFGEGETFEYTFEEPGTYEYFCRPHPFMTGEVIVSDEDPEPAEPGVVVTDQAIVNDTLTYEDVISDGPGWIDNHAD